MAASIDTCVTPSKNVCMGQSRVARAPEALKSVLGSCIGVALYHSRLQIGALAHVVLPESAGRASKPGKFADTAIPHLIELLANEGADISGCVAKLAGGASMFAADGPMKIGVRNHEAVVEQLKKFNIRAVGEHVGGSKGRRVTLDCATGDLTVEIVGEPPFVL